MNGPIGVRERGDAAAYRLFRYGARAVVAAPGGPAPLLRAGIRCYRTETPRRALYRAVLLFSAAMRCDRLLGSAVPLPLPDGVATAIAAWLATFPPTTERTSSIVVCWPPQLDRGRVYLHVLDESGHPVCFVKVSTDEKNDRMLLHEATTLAGLSQLPRQRLEVPTVLGILRGDGHVMLVLAPLPAGHTRPMPYPSDVVREYAADVRAARAADLSVLGWFADGFAAGADLHPRFRAELTAYLARDESPWALCRAHGDLSRHNLVTADGRLWLFDWEESAPDAPVATDELGYALSGLARRIIRRPSAWRRIVDRSAPQLTTLSRRDLMMALLYRGSRRMSDARAITSHWQLSDGWGRP